MIANITSAPTPSAATRSAICGLTGAAFARGSASIMRG